MQIRNELGPVAPEADVNYYNVKSETLKRERELGLVWICFQQKLQITRVVSVSCAVDRRSFSVAVVDVKFDPVFMDEVFMEIQWTNVWGRYMSDIGERAKDFDGTCNLGTFQ